LQVTICIKETLYEYYEKVKGKNIDIFLILELYLDVYNHCPICGGVDCAQFIGYYPRKVVDKNGKSYDDFPIARFLCHRKGTNIEIDHKTFSLLPYQLIPYRKYSIPFIEESLSSRYIEGRSICNVLDDIAQLGKEDILSTSSSQLLGFDKLVAEAIDKILASGYYPEFEQIIFNQSSVEATTRHFIEFAQAFECVKVDSGIKGACGLGYDFYLSGGGYYKNAQYLFGKPSQFRDRGS
jgi:hypothetical protein